MGNPTIASGPFHAAFTEQRSGWKCFTIDAFDTPNLKGITLEQLIDPAFESEIDKDACPYLTRRRWVKERYFEWGVDHPSWESRVRGNFPKQSADALFSLAWLEAAKTRELEMTGEFDAGLDVAGGGEDETSLTVRSGPRIVKHVQFTAHDPRGAVVEALNEYKGALKSVNVDCVGIGWGMYQHLKDLGFPAIPINACASSSDSDKYADSKTEFFWALRERFKNAEV